MSDEDDWGDTDRTLESLRRVDAGPDVSDILPIDDNFVSFTNDEIKRLQELDDDDAE